MNTSNVTDSFDELYDRLVQLEQSYKELNLRLDIILSMYKELDEPNYSFDQENRLIWHFPPEEVHLDECPF